MEISHKKGHRWANLYSRTLVCCRRLYCIVFSNCVKTCFSLRSMSEILQPFTFLTTSKGTFLCTGDTLSKRETLQMWSFLVFSIEEIQWNLNRHPRESSYWRLYCVVSFLLEWIEESDLLNLISASWKISSIVYMMRILLHRWKIKYFKLQLIITKAHTCFFKKKTFVLDLCSYVFLYHDSNYQSW